MKEFKGLKEINAPYIIITSKNLANDTFSGKYIDPNNPEKCFIFNDIKFIFSSNLQSLINSKSPSIINREDGLL